MIELNPEDLLKLLALAREEGRKTNAYSSTTEETSRPGPDNVRSGRSVTPSKDQKEKLIRELYRLGSIDRATFSHLMAELRGSTATSASAEDNDDENMRGMPPSFWD